MSKWINVLGLAGLAFSFALNAQPNRPVEAFGDASAGQFGDEVQGNFGDPSYGEFRRYNFSRDQEGTVPVLPGAPLGRFEAVPPPPRQSATETVNRRGNDNDAPYVTLSRPVDGGN